MIKNLKNIPLIILWVIFVPFAYSIKILSYLIFKIKYLLAVINNKIKNS